MKDVTKNSQNLWFLSLPWERGVTFVDSDWLAKTQKRDFFWRVTAVRSSFARGGKIMGIKKLILAKISM